MRDGQVKLLRSLTDTELQQELERRKEERARQVPSRLPNPQMRKVIVVCTDVVVALSSRGRCKDPEVQVFEVAMEAVYGKAFWPWWNQANGCG